MRLTSDVVTDWLESFGRVWREADAIAAAGIMTPDASYRNSPFLDVPYVGFNAIKGFWDAALVGVTDVKFHYGTPVIEGSRAGVEWWTTLRSYGEPYTLAGNFLLTFDGSLVSDLRESFVKQSGAHPPHDGWGV